VARRLLIPILAVVALATLAGSAAADLHSRKESVDSRLSTLRGKIDAAKTRESALESQISSVSGQIQGLNTQVRDVSTRLVVYERDLALHREKLQRLTELFQLQTRRLVFLRAQYRTAVERLDLRLVAVYQSNDVGTLEVVLSSASFSDLLDRLDYLQNIGLQDQEIASTVKDAKTAMRIARVKTRKTKAVVASATRTIAAQTAQVRAARDELLARQSALAAARSRQRGALSDIRSSTREMLSEAESLQASSAAIAAQIRSAEARAAAASSSSGSSSSGSSASGGYSPGTPSSSGLIWPVNGPVVSPFGYRCLGGICRMHEGIDIAVPSGTPIHAAAAGTVIIAGWEEGYGNIIVIDHGHGLATAYAHQQGFAVGSGAHVAQGQVIGYSDCTGRCFGPHVHFEVRVNGSAVDPMGYL
jgi:murein DD-endopeptidase MepM/ murein hydrolase activator NlpD